MANAHSDGANHGSVKSYVIGFILSVILTVIPFGLVMYPTLPKMTTLAIVLLFAVIQVVVHLVYFLHLDRSPAQRNNVAALVFSAQGELGLRTVDDAGTVGFASVKLAEDGLERVWVTGLPGAAQVIVQGQDFVAEGQKVQAVAAVSSAKARQVAPSGSAAVN